MSCFDSTLVVETDAVKDFKLPHTRQMILVKNVSSIQSSPFPKYLHVFGRSCMSYQLAPFKLLRTFEYSEDVMDAVAIRGKMAVLSRDSIVVWNKGKEQVIAGKFDGRLSEVDGCLGVQERAKLSVYSLETLEVMKVYKANAHCSIRDVLVTSLDNLVSLYFKGGKILEISMPEAICKLCTDPLLTNIYCGTGSGTIFCCNTSNGEPSSMKYHRSQVVGLGISFCGKYLYSADMEGLVCIWDTKFNTVVGKVSMESEIRRMKVVYVSEWRKALDTPEDDLIIPGGTTK
ncbi:uncharacterized protein Eint_091230 [Encephalitozoon intestinalis ATCC 50506]|uniref:WD40 domain-containing protein n=1 Tax=Encephalitozoon intestinalis (strain ATCC 50506) TaxID=876142 RepID=E0S8Y6_ENCIT|nr:uncharacterized protein Eint_091230 [Encephalitozoon intestinalis ATCC 50506]ADM12252.1 hypothetical protein Eint_091230 [Encephalitozoon intestinalis ATCC 50506]UTX46059.1 hypothetical protein GPK93_09g16450 [Encephalitozoon intestinalis]